MTLTKRSWYCFYEFRKVTVRSPPVSQSSLHRLDYNPCCFCIHSLFAPVYALRFVILYHEFPDGHPRQSHWDFMLEPEPSAGGEAKLKTWALEKSPLDWLKASESGEPQKAKIQATRLPDHRRHYLTYEGPVSNDRGQVRQIASGTYSILESSEAEMIIELLPTKQKKFTVRIQRTEPAQRSFFAFGSFDQ